jgi:hypothetical protein
VWSYSYGHANDIIETLRKQWASLFHDCIGVWRKLHAQPTTDFIQRLSGESLRLVVEQPPQWEYLLFLDLLQTRLDSLSHLKRDALLGLNLANNRSHISLRDYPRWMSAKMAELQEVAKALNALFSESLLEEAFGHRGVPGNPETISYLADRITAMSEYALNWMQSVRGTITHPLLHNLKELSSRFSRTVIDDIERFIATFKSEMELLRSSPVKSGETRYLNIVLKLTFDHELNEKIEAEMERVSPLIIDELSRMGD